MILKACSAKAIDHNNDTEKTRTAFSAMSSPSVVVASKTCARPPYPRGGPILLRLAMLDVVVFRS